ncbi:DUF6134 family protein [Phenylobacterium sp.]|uniref:DUF6134 family protein n=1 Tax=Phenylobacterium sp. TaxID=1871053 RepID=UPI002730D735|nr:DUF6134 family protein [Phenylobacterium sp.]MDP1873276.1 DUF6134 family protein [Phenylobacterium sp.]MDP3299074.1 DUF6134 family protein [Phenylobacterium sp.]MDP3635003.1 DUF6134 family protein [Phenylobacterium sp.]
MNPPALILLSRRSLLGASLGALVAPGALAAVPSNGRLAFAVFRGKDKVGEHLMRFTRSGGVTTVSTEVEMRVRLGPIPVFRYAHTATERWRGDSFASLTTRTETNGKVEQVEAEASASGVAIEGPGGRLAAPASAAPLTHWNTAAFARPLFNPQLGKLMRIRATRVGADSVQLANGQSVPATRWTLRGEAEIDNWYDSTGAWAGLRGKLEDGSTMIYRRI